MELFNFIAEIPYVETIVNALIAAHALAIFVVNMTDTPKDNSWLATAYKYIEFFAGIIRASKVKQPNPVSST